MLNNQDFMEMKDQGISERARNDEDRLINGFKWNYDYFDDQDHTDIHLQIVPEVRKEDNSKKDLTLVVPDEHSETGDHNLSNEYSESSDNRCYLRNKHEKRKRPRIEIFSDDEESDGFTREVPSVIRRGSKRRRDEIMMSNKMRTLQQLIPNCHKMDKVSVLDKAIDYMKKLQLQHKVMTIMGMNPYIPPDPAILNFGIHNQLLTAMALSHGLNPANQATSPPLIPASNWPLPPFTNLSFPDSSNQSLFVTTSAYSPQCLCGLVPCFPSFQCFL